MGICSWRTSRTEDDDNDDVKIIENDETLHGLHNENPF